MAKDHYVPAAFLGGFSRDRKGRRRNRTLSVIDRSDGRLVARSASDIAWQDDMYSLIDGAEKQDDGRSDSVGWTTADVFWGDYEQLLPEALERLRVLPPWRTYPAEPWLRVLVPFIGGLLGRGPDFHERHSTRISGVDLFSKVSTSNSARITELGRLLAPLCAADWTFCTFDDEAELITSDRGYAWITDPFGEVGIAVPVSPTGALLIVPQQERLVLRAAGDGWVTQFRVRRESLHDAHALNQAVAGAAFNFIAGGDSSLVARYKKDLLTSVASHREPYSDAWPPSRVRRLHEWDWHRLVGVVAQPPSLEIPIPMQLSDFGDDVYVRGKWAPPPMIAITYPAYGTGLRRFGDIVSLRLLSSDQANLIHRTALDGVGRGVVDWNTWGIR